MLILFYVLKVKYRESRDFNSEIQSLYTKLRVMHRHHTEQLNQNYVSQLETRASESQFNLLGPRIIIHIPDFQAQNHYLRFQLEKSKAREKLLETKLQKSMESEKQLELQLIFSEDIEKSAIRNRTLISRSDSIPEQVPQQSNQQSAFISTHQSRIQTTQHIIHQSPIQTTDAKSLQKRSILHFSYGKK